MSRTKDEAMDHYMETLRQDADYAEWCSAVDCREHDGRRVPMTDLQAQVEADRIANAWRDEPMAMADYDEPEGLAA